MYSDSVMNNRPRKEALNNLSLKEIKLKVKWTHIGWELANVLLASWMIHWPCVGTMLADTFGDTLVRSDSFIYSMALTLPSLASWSLTTRSSTEVDGVLFPLSSLLSLMALLSSSLILPNSRLQSILWIVTCWRRNHSTINFQTRQQVSTVMKQCQGQYSGHW